MTRKRCTGKALAERRRRAMQFHIAGFTREEIAEKVGMHRSAVCRDLQWIRDSSCPGESPDVQEACFIQIERMALPVLGAKCSNCRMGFSPSMARFSGRRAKAHPTATPRTGRAERMKFDPQPGQFDPRQPPLAGTSSPEEAAASWKDRRIYDPAVDGYGPQLKL